uniref:Protein kinase domain-containing protein n=1 Tax=Salix viminalis TaxID=40686 RepID=A0A6N2MT16_SALVM
MDARVSALESILESIQRLIEDKFASIDKRFDAIESRRKNSDQTFPPPTDEDEGDSCRRQGERSHREKEKGLPHENRMPFVKMDQREREREGWGAVIAKTVSLDAAKVINVTPRYARLRAGANGSAKGQIIGWENIELISDQPLETMLKEFKQLKGEYPDRILIASIMEEYNKVAWEALQWYQWEEYASSCSSWEDFVKIFCRDFGSHGFEDYYERYSQLGEGQFGVIRVCTDKLTREVPACKSVAKDRLVTSEDARSVKFS